ncbi:MAG: PEP-CTERM sorting domain-containing protein [Planctomycetota bacterium]
MRANQNGALSENQCGYVTIVVPEPTTLLLLSMGGLLIRKPK